MGRKVASGAAVMLVLLGVGGGAAQGRTLAVSNVMVQVIGLGTVSSGSDGINCGNGLRTCRVAFSTGPVTLTATPAAGWAFGSWNNCPTPSGNTCTVAVNGTDHDITANFTGPPTSTSTLSVTFSGTGTVTGGAINCGSGPSQTACSSTVLTGSTLTVLETPGAGQIFTGWSGGCSGTGVSCTMTMDTDKKVNASWAGSSQTHLLTVSISGSGSVHGTDISCAPVCTAQLPQNSTETLTATPSDGYAFTGWSGACSGSSPTCIVTMDADKPVTATFAAAPKLTVSVSGNGNISGGSGAINCGNNGNSCSAQFAQGQTVTLTATAGTGSTFIGWSGACGGTALSCSVVMSDARSVTATFSGGTTTVPLSVSVSGLGRVTGAGINCGNGGFTCSADETPNASVTLTAIPATGATFSGWGGSCTGTNTTCSVSMTGARNVTATFAGGTSNVSLTVSVTGRGRVSGGGITCGTGGSTCTVSAPLNSTIVLRATPVQGGKFKGWGGSCSGTTTTCSVTLTATKTVSASFTGTGSSGSLTRVGPARVKRSRTGFLVTLRFTTPAGGTAQVRGLRAGRVVTKLSRRVSAGTVSVGPFRVGQPGLYTFELTLGGRTIRWRTCLGRCGAAAPGPKFVLERGTPTTTRSGDVWSLTLRARESVVSEGHARVFRAGKVLLDRRFLGNAGAVSVGPFLLAPGSYTLRLTATDAFGRARSLTWIVNLAR